MAAAALLNMHDRDISLRHHFHSNPCNGHLITAVLLHISLQLPRISRSWSSSTIVPITTQVTNLVMSMSKCRKRDKFPRSKSSCLWEIFIIHFHCPIFSNILAIFSRSKWPPSSMDPERCQAEFLV